MPILLWTSNEVRSGWFLKEGDSLIPVWGPSICISSGGGPQAALDQLRDQGYVGPVELQDPPTHDDVDGHPCFKCNAQVLEINAH